MFSLTMRSYLFKTVQDTRTNTGAVTNTYTTYNSSDVILYGRQHSTATTHDLRIRIDDSEGFTSSFFDFKIANLAWVINNRP